MDRKILLINQMQPVWLFISSCKGFEHTHKTLQDCKTALISQFWSVMVLSVGSLMLLVMQSHMGFIVTLFMWYVMGQVMQSIEGLKTSWLWLSNTYFMDTLTISIYPPPPPLSPRPIPLPPSPQLTKQMFIQSFSLNEWFVTLSTWVQLLSSMNEQMSADASSLSEYLFAFCATVWILSTVMEYVLIQTLSLSAWHFTRATWVRLLLTVNE